jgi:hypothetical protein
MKLSEVLVSLVFVVNESHAFYDGLSNTCLHLKSDKQNFLGAHSN